MTRPCRLEAIVGRDRPCPEMDCPFWEPGAVLDGRCLFERIDMSPWPALAADLVALREELDAARASAADAAKAG